MHGFLAPSAALSFSVNTSKLDYNIISDTPDVLLVHIVIVVLVTGGFC
jgi:hypothetical protein